MSFTSASRTCGDFHYNPNEVCSNCREEWELSQRDEKSICRTSQQVMKEAYSLKPADNCPICQHVLACHSPGAATVASSTTTGNYLFIVSNLAVPIQSSDSDRIFAPKLK